MNIKHARTAREVKTIERHGAKYQIECTRTFGLNDGSVTEQTRVQDAIAKRSRLPSDGTFQSSLTFGKSRGTPILAFDEVTIKKISGQLARSFEVDLSKVFPPVPNDDTQTAPPTAGRVQTPVVLDFAAVMPAPTVNVAPAPAPIVNVVNELPPAPPLPAPVKELRIIRDDNGTITGALLS